MLLRKYRVSLWLGASLLLLLAVVVAGEAANAAGTGEGRGNSGSGQVNSGAAPIESLYLQRFGSNYAAVTVLMSEAGEQPGLMYYRWRLADSPASGPFIGSGTETLNVNYRWPLAITELAAAQSYTVDVSVSADFQVKRSLTFSTAPAITFKSLSPTRAVVTVAGVKAPAQIHFRIFDKRERRLAFAASATGRIGDITFNYYGLETDTIYTAEASITDRFVYNQGVKEDLTTPPDTGVVNLRIAAKTGTDLTAVVNVTGKDIARPPIYWRLKRAGSATVIGGLASSYGSGLEARYTFSGLEVDGRYRVEVSAFPDFRGYLQVEDATLGWASITGLAVSDVAADRLTVTASVSAGGVLPDSIYLRILSKGRVLFSITKPASRSGVSHTFTGLSPGLSHQVQVSRVRDFDRSVSLATESARTDRLHTVSGVRAGEITAGSITVVATVVDSVPPEKVYFELTETESLDGPNSGLNSGPKVNRESEPGKLGQVSHTFSGLRQATSYTVRAATEADYSAGIKNRFATGHFQVSRGRVSDLTPQSVRVTVQVDAASVGDLIYFRLREAISGGREVTEKSVAAPRQLPADAGVAFTELSPGTSYYVKIGYGPGATDVVAVAAGFTTPARNAR